LRSSKAASGRSSCRLAALAVLAGICLSAQTAEARPAIRHVFVIAMENAPASHIYGNPAAPYINNRLLPKYAHANNFNDVLPNLPSEPQYILMEAGTNVFADANFQTDSPPSAANSTASKDHLVSQIRRSGHTTWATYQESIDATSGGCPVASSFPYAPKHNPFVFFRDVAGNPPSQGHAYCVSHTKPYSALSGDLEANDIANYVFITPNLCHDMHGATDCPKGDRIAAGDVWLSSNLPPIIRWANNHAGVIFIVWDEGNANGKIPFLAVGPGVRSNYSNNTRYVHGSLVKTVETIFRLPILPTVAQTNDFPRLFKPHFYP
jgi:hypothetical protein